MNKRYKYLLQKEAMIRRKLLGVNMKVIYIGISSTLRGTQFNVHYKKYYHEFISFVQKLYRCKRVVLSQYLSTYELEICIDNSLHIGKNQIVYHSNLFDLTFNENIYKHISVFKKLALQLKYGDIDIETPFQHSHIIDKLKLLHSSIFVPYLHYFKNVKCIVTNEFCFLRESPVLSYIFAGNIKFSIEYICYILTSEEYEELLYVLECLCIDKYNTPKSYMIKSNADQIHIYNL